MSRDLLEESNASFFKCLFICVDFSPLKKKGEWQLIEFVFARFDDKEVQRDMKLAPYKIVNKDGKPYIQVQIRDGETKVFSPEEISAMILTKMKETAEAFLGKKIKDAVVTVPG